MKIFVTMILTAVALALPNFAMANVEIEWENPKKYTDVRPTTQTKQRFRKTVFKDIESYLVELTDALPESQKLVIKVTNLDLAGHVWPASHIGLGHSNADIRVIKNHDIPRMAFNYQLLDQSGAVIQSKQVKLKDMGFFDRNTRFFKNDSLRYEKSMLKRWFEEEFSSQLKS